MKYARLNVIEAGFLATAGIIVKMSAETAGPAVTGHIHSAFAAIKLTEEKKANIRSPGRCGGALMFGAEFCGFFKHVRIDNRSGTACNQLATEV